MVKDELRKLLNQPYKSENWKKVTEFVFPNVSYFQKPQVIPIKDAYKNIVDSFNVLGYVRLQGGKNLAIFEIKVTDKVSLNSNRVQLRQIVAEHINQETNHGVLAIYDQDKEDYRFTFTAKSTEFDEAEGGFKNIETDAKRFTYILGKNESCKTAANRFWELSGNKENATIKDVEQAFSVERLNKEFFDKYKGFYEDFVQHLTGKRFEKEKGKWEEKIKGKPIPEHKIVFDSNDKLARNFVKLLLGRLVFIQFLQKKGWMGVPANNKKWKNGEKDFINQLFNSTKHQEKFHSDVLHELFYNAFNTPNRPNDIFELTGTRVPYLNGGLFENEYSKTELINFPTKYFQDLLDFFSQYNFTIDENDPLDHEVGIDPEMLGHIFENLLEDNKDKGAFYTPKPIVQYMCQESLIQYLKTYLTKEKKWSSDIKKSSKLYDGLQNFVRRKAAADIIDFDEQIAIALRDVKICDPAIGSGAFPMGLLNEIFYCIQVLYNASPDVVGEVWKMQKWEADTVKKNIIQNSIYGVDLEKGAVDIARLRFWLSLIVDEKEPSPLPNLDYKILVGDSLSKIDLYQRDIFIENSIREYEELKPKYFNAFSPSEKSKLKNRINELLEVITNGNKNFDIKIYFSDVFHDKGGFDIVIANPPYIEFKNLAKDIKNKIEKNFKTLTGKYDIYVAFLELNHEILNSEGLFCYINPTRFFQRDYGTAIRKFIYNNYTPISIIDFSDKQIFETALTYTGIYTFKNFKATTEDNSQFYYSKAKNDSLIKSANELFFNASTNFGYSIRPNIDLANDIWYFYENEKKDNLLKIKQNALTLESITKGIFQGVATGKDSVFLVDRATIDSFKLEYELLHKFIKGKDIKPFKIVFNDKYLIYPYDENGKVINENVLKSKYPNIYKYLSSKKEDLQGRDYFDKSTKLWFELWNQRNLNLFKSEKIVTLDNAKRNSFAYDDQEYMSATTVYSLILKDNIGISYYKLLGILNSTLLNYYHKENTIPQAGGFFRYQAIFIKDLPIKMGISDDVEVLVKKLLEPSLSESEMKSYQNEIDLYVYKHYDITYEEAKIIDPTLTISEKEYLG